MSGYTKGPWIHDGDGWITAESGESVVDYAGCGSHEADWRNPSDLQLALAAPDLLEALEQLFRIGDVYRSAIEHDAYGEYGSKMDLEQWADLAKAAIAKARGEK